MEQTLTRDHLSVIRGITQDGTLYTMSYRESINGQRCVALLRHLVLHRGRVLVIWDGAPIHRSQAVKDYLAEQVDGHLHLEQLPGYTPECNPEEGV